MVRRSFCTTIRVLEDIAYIGRCVGADCTTFSMLADEAMSDNLATQVQAALEQLNLLRENAIIVVAVSGGPDSLGLLHMLWQLRDEGGPALHIAHLDHGFRGEQSAAEARYVAQIANDWGIAATIETYDVRSIALARRQNNHVAARSVRYAFLARVALRERADAVAVAHQADDQAETVLLHLLHGTGLAGLRGMRVWTPWPEWVPCEVQSETPAGQPADLPGLVRPLLHTARSLIEDYCVAHHLSPNRDPSNESPDYTRSRVRSDLMPVLTRFNPQIVATLGRMARIFTDDYEYIQSQLDVHWPTLADERGDRVEFQRAVWSQLPLTLQRYALRRAAVLLTDADELSYDQVEAGRMAAAREAGVQHHLGCGLGVRIESEVLVIASLETLRQMANAVNQTDAVPQLNTETLALRVPGVTPINAKWSVVTTFEPPAETATEIASAWRWHIALDADRIDGPLFLRCRRPGDRFRPAGGAGSRLLQDFFVDHKVPRTLRARWPLVTAPNQIVWVAGLRADESCAPGPHTRRTLWIAFTSNDSSQEHSIS